MLGRAIRAPAGRIASVRSNAFVCRSCRTEAIESMRPSAAFKTSRPNHALRPFTSSTYLSKKAGKKNLSQARSDPPPTTPDSVTAPQTTVDEAFDFSDLEAKILKTIEWLSHQLSTLRAGGRMNPETVEKLKVVVKLPGTPGRSEKDGEHETYRLSEVAQVVVQGRFVKIIANDEEYIKPITSSILSSTLNLTPQPPTPQAPTTITIPLPPPTAESRQQAIDQASKWAEEATSRIREARGAHQKKLRGFQVAKSVRPDDLQKAGKEMEEVVKGGNEEVKRVLEGAKRVLSGGTGGIGLGQENGSRYLNRA